MASTGESRLREWLYDEEEQVLSRPDPSSQPSKVVYLYDEQAGNCA